ncbi:PH domain-containing protein [Nitriliruptor alkaliphilus]|uniref:PH domain-containing protein n=1 Tax=Nitriliruptor alkaliphilus TaxID=427918 RepID=UPI000695B469|nr:PH domain-containing protein [Nitriliruptor alkaliphilus]
MRYPERLLTEDEEIVRQFRPHWRVLLPSLSWAMILAVGVGVGFAFDPPVGRIALGVAVLIWLLVAGRAVLDYWFTNYVLTTERIIVRSGMVARNGTEIPLENINNVLFSQRVIERLLGYGDVMLESAGSQGQSRLEDIPDPEAFQSQVYRVREARSLALRHGPGPANHADGDVVTRLERLADLRERGHLSEDEFAEQKRRLLDG